MLKSSDDISFRFNLALISVARVAKTSVAIAISNQTTGITLNVWMPLSAPA